MVELAKQSAFIFSGTGTQKPGMGGDFYEQYPEFKRTYECASDIFGFDVAKTAFNATSEEISATAVSHRLIYAFEMGVFAVAAKRLPAPVAFAGHSLGEMAALSACGVFNCEQGFMALKWRSQYLDDASEAVKGSMCAVLGATPQAVAEACQKTGGFVLPVNFNAPSQTVISGDKGAVNDAVAALKEQGARCMMLPVNVPFHTVRLKEASQRLCESLKTLPLNPKPAAKFFCNVTGGEMTDFSNIAQYLAQQMISPVLFTDEVNAMQKDGVTQYIELGASKVLTGLVKKIIKGSDTVNLDTAEAFSAYAK
ncbi:MAG: ACP S-malonyltransferase [Hydrogenoanaerobacterium sp.]